MKRIRLKKSSRMLLALLIVGSIGLYATNSLLRAAYHRIDLEDPYRNYETLPAAPFRFVKVEGGNGFSIKIESGEVPALRVMRSRKEFLQTSRVGDTLFVRFGVSNSYGQPIEALPVGLILTAPGLSRIEAKGNSLLVQHWKGGKLVIRQSGGAALLQHVRCDSLQLEGSGSAAFELRGTHSHLLSARLGDEAWVHLEEARFRQFRPQLEKKARLSLSGPVLQHWQELTP